MTNRHNHPTTTTNHNPTPSAPEMEAAPPAAPPGDAGEREYTFESLLAALGPPDEDARAAVFEVASEADLVEMGVRVDSDNILADAPRFLGSAHEILLQLTPEQRSRVHLSPALLALALDEMTVLRRMKTDYDACTTANAGGKAARETAAREELTDGIAERDNCYTAVRSALDAKRRAHLDEIVGTADTPEALAGGVGAVADFVDELLATKSPRLRKRLGLFGVTAAMPKALRARAASVREAGKITATPAPRVTLRRLNLQDGRCLLLVDRILRGFRAANRADRSILVPELRAIAWMFDTRRRARTKAATPASTTGGATATNA